MLTRLKVSGFKNLVDVDIHFGPFTCVAGANGVGKSNLFDAIAFLSALADRPLLDAALSIRDEGGRTSDVRGLFHRVGNTSDNRMSFQAEMIVPAEGRDDLGQPAHASITFLRYSVELAYRIEGSGRSLGSLELLKEELVHINQRDARAHLPFPHTPAWRRSAVHGQRRGGHFISTEGEGPNRIIKLHQDGGSSGRPRSLLAENLPRTVISASNAAESPTALLARKEMQSWRLLQLEPSALRMPDPFTAPTRLGTDGSHLAASLYHLARLEEGPVGNGSSEGRVRGDAYTQAANRLAELIGDVRSINVDRDERRELLTLRVMSRDGTSHDARALSDGTLRFLALTVLELDPQTHGLLCLEAPENGIHPARIPAMLQLLIDLAVDTDQPVGHDNPLRQVIVNTYSPSMMAQVPADSLIVAELQERVEAGRRFQAASFRWLPDTWRVQGQPEVYPLPRGKLLEYLNPVMREEPVEEGDGWEHDGRPKKSERPRRVIDRPDFQPYLAYFMPSSA